MKNLLKIITILLLFSSPIMAQDSIKKLPNLQKDRIQTIDIKHIVLNLKFDWKLKQAIGTAKISFSTLKSTNKIFLDGGFLTINSIKLNGKKLKFNYDGKDTNDNLEILLNKSYQPSENLTIMIDYHTNYANEIDPNILSGNLGKGLRFSQPTSNDPLKPMEIWSMGEPESNRYWFPSFDAPNDLRTSEFIATVPKKMMVILNGKMIKSIDNLNNTKTVHFKCDFPHQNHQTSFVVGEFVNIKQKYEAINLNNYGYPNEKKWVEATVEQLPEMMGYFSDLTNKKYPFPNCSQVFVQDIGTFTSNNSVATITENMVDDYETHKDFFYLWDLTEAEALANQWFGNYIMCKDWSEIWLNKGFSHYFNQLYSEHKNGKDEFLLYSNSNDLTVYLGDWNAGFKQPLVTKNYENNYDFVNSNYPIYRGALVLHALRKQLGEENWLKSIRYYVKNYGKKTVTTKDFIDAIETASGEKTDWFFDQWVYKMGHPVFEITKKYDTEKKQLTLVILQTQKQDLNNQYPQNEYFKGNVSIEIDNKIETVWIDAKTENIFVFNVLENPKFVNFDSENACIKEVKFEKSVDEYLNQMQKSKDALARQFALNELVKIFKNEKTTIEIKQKIQTAFIDLVLSKEYFRLKNLAIVQLRNMNLNTENKTDETIISMLETALKTEKSWTLAAVLVSLGNTKNDRYTDLYISMLNHESDRVISAAASALGKTKSPKAFEALEKLTKKPSMKSQSLLCAFAGFKELGDPRAFEIIFNALKNKSLPRWRLPDFSIWDYRIFAAQLITSLGKSELAFPLIFEQLRKSMTENNLRDELDNLLIINELADKNGQEAYNLLKEKYKNNKTVLEAIINYESVFKSKIK